MLANAVYLKAAWQDQFSASATAPRAFTTADGRVVRPLTIRPDELLNYARGPGWQAVELPYVGGLAMRVLLPDPGHNLAGTLTATTLRALPAKSQDAEVNLELPRWRTNTSLNPLGLPGLSTAAAAADFSGIAPALSSVPRSTARSSAWTSKAPRLLPSPASPSPQADGLPTNTSSSLSTGLSPTKSSTPRQMHRCS